MFSFQPDSVYDLVRLRTTTQRTESHRKTRCLEPRILLKAVEKSVGAMARPSYKSREVAAEPSAVIRSLDQEQAQASNSRQFKTRITHNPSCYVSSEQMNRAPWNDSKSTGFSQDKMGPQDPIVFGNGISSPCAEYRSCTYCACAD